MVIYEAGDKGDPVTIIGGKYRGKNSWMQNGKCDTLKKCHVIITLGNGKEKSVCINKDIKRNMNMPYNTGAPSEKPKTLSFTLYRLHYAQIKGEFVRTRTSGIRVGKG